MKNKKIIGLISGVIAFVAAFAVVVFMFLPQNDGAADKVFTYEELTITLTENFEKSEDASGYSAAYTDSDVVVMILREGFELMEGFESYSLSEYGGMIINNNNYSTELKENDTGVYFEYTTNPDGNDYHYVYYLYKSSKAFYMIGFATLEGVKDDFRADIEKYAKSVKFTDSSISLTPEGTENKPCEHTYSDWQKTKSPSCGEKGEEKRVCSICGHKEIRILAKLGNHNFMANKKCSVCGETMNPDFVFELTADGKSYKFSHWGENVKKVVVPATFNGKPVTEINEMTFWQETALEEVVLPDSITTIGNLAFNGCKNLRKINTPKNLTSIGKNAFNGCSKLSSFDIPEAITKIEEGTFYGCEKLKITLHNKLTRIEKEAFFGCNFSSMIIPASVSFIGEGAFSECKIKYLTIEEGTKLTVIPKKAFAHSSAVNIIIPEGIKTIEREAFDDNYIKNLTLPKSIESIGEKAFFRGEDNITIRFSGSEEDWQKISLGRLIVKATAEVTYVFAG